MPKRPTHPGVYSNESQTSTRSITGVATSIAAFVGRTQRGPVDVPVLAESWDQFECNFGGLWSESRLAFSVRDFFDNGGRQALVVRVFNPCPQAGAAGGDDGSGNYDPVVATFDANGLQLRAASPGAWGNALRVRIEAPDPDTLEQRARALGVQAGDLFTLHVRDPASDTEETFSYVTVVDSARRVDTLLAEQSTLIRTGPLAMPTPHAQRAASEDIWADDRLSTGVAIGADDGLPLDAACLIGDTASETGLHALAQADLFNLLYIPPYKATDGITDQDVDPAVIAAAAICCEARRAFLILDAPSTWHDPARAEAGVIALGTRTSNAAVYFPRLRQHNPLRDGAVETVAPGGAVAGIIARSDARHGVWKSPAGPDTGMRGFAKPSLALTDREGEQLNRMGINCLRSFPGHPMLVWGARTLHDDDQAGGDWTYITVRRIALHIEDSLLRGTEWVIHEPNDEPLWARIRKEVCAFMDGLFRAGALQGTTPSQAYYVRCGSETTTQADILEGFIDIEVGFAPLRPAEFVTLKIPRHTAPKHPRG